MYGHTLDKECIEGTMRINTFLRALHQWRRLDIAYVLLDDDDDDDFKFHIL